MHSKSRQVTYLRAVWLQIKADHNWKDIALHSLFGIVTPIIAAWLEFEHAIIHGPATFSRDEIARPLGSAIYAFSLTLMLYLVFVVVKANKRLYDRCQTRIDSLQVRVASFEADTNAKQPQMNLEAIDDEPGTLRVTNAGGETRGKARIRIKEMAVERSLYTGGPPIAINSTFGAKWLEAADAEGYVIFHKGVPHFLRLAERMHVGESNDATWRIHYVEGGESKVVYFASRPAGGVPTSPPNRAVIAVTLAYEGMTQEIDRTYEIAGAAFREGS